MSDLPDLTPQSLNHTIRAFISGLCCLTHPIAIVAGQRVCQDHFDALREDYGAGWNL